MSRFPDRRSAMSYLAGVVAGDGYLASGDTVVGLAAKDRDFVEAFADAVELAFGTRPRVRVREVHYWVARLTRKGVVDEVRRHEPVSDDDASMWLRGFFDSDGCASLSPNKASPGAWNRHVAMFKANAETIDRASRLLDQLGIENVVTVRPPQRQRNRHGTKAMYRVRVRNSRQNLERFRCLVGSSLARKRDGLRRIVATYTDRSEYSSRGGQRGAATRWGGRTHCGHGHELTDENVYVARGARRCRTCRREQQRARRAKARRSV